MATIVVLGAAWIAALGIDNLDKEMGERAFAACGLATIAAFSFLAFTAG